MRLATAAYPLDPVTCWAEYSDKLERWVAGAAAHADLLVFPEYAAMELAMLAGPDVAGDLHRSLRAVSDRLARADDVQARLAQSYGVHICAGSAPVFDPQYPDGPVNRARLITPAGAVAVQDKQIMTRWEREPMGAVPGGGVQVFDTALGRVAILICYDAEFPLLGRAVHDAEILLVPSCTETRSGYWRVRIGAMARALEAQCVSVMSSVVGEARWNDVADTTTGAGGIFGPPDTGFPETGIIAEGRAGVPGWTFGQVDLDAIATVRADGQVLGRAHWPEHEQRSTSAPIVPLDGSFA
ncbi:MAG: carbon-nitrogen hydrolase family protein [Pseudomonadota bacterium]